MTTTAQLDVVTGAFSYSGAAIARELRAAGHRVRTLTGHPERAPAGPDIEVRPLDFAEKVWMGWERKRGKILDLNALLLNQADRFPVKAGNLAVLSTIRYVITLDQDTQILKDSARTLVGALAHPLNRAVVDPVINRVVEGYAILQPRVAVIVIHGNAFALQIRKSVYSLAAHQIIFAPRIVALADMNIRIAIQCFARV